MQEKSQEFPPFLRLLSAKVKGKQNVLKASRLHTVGKTAIFSDSNPFKNGQ